MITIIQSNRIESLAAQLAEELSHRQTQSLLSTQQVLVQSQGMAQWLNIIVAEKKGICANVDHPLPAQFLWSIFIQCFPEKEINNLLDASDLTWQLLYLFESQYDQLPDALCQLLQNNQYPAYPLQLAQNLAKLLHQYIIFRPEWLLCWKESLPIKESLTDEGQTLAQWQEQLWQLVLIHFPAIKNNLYRLLSAEQLTERLQDPKLILNLPETIYVFGLTALPPIQLNLFTALSSRINIVFFVHNPCQHYWGDIVDNKNYAKLNVRYLSTENNKEEWLKDSAKTQYFSIGNPLLAAHGRMGREYIDTLLQLPADWHDHFITQEPTTLLTQIQTDILELTGTTELPWQTSEQIREPVVMATNDRSICFQNCHSRLREIEVLYDYLLEEFNLNTELQPKDIIVMVPNLADYVPFIQAVFSVQPSERRIPFTVSDQNTLGEYPLIHSFLQLLSLPNSRFCLSDVFSLLEVPAIYQKFTFDRQDVLQIQQILGDLNIHWGVDSLHQQDLGFSEVTQGDWQFGLERLLLGYAVNSDDEELFMRYPFTHIEGDSAEILGRFIYFFRLLVQTHERLIATKTSEEIIDLAFTIVECFYEQSDEAILLIIKQLTILKDIVMQYELQQAFNRESLIHYLESIFAEDSHTSGFYSGRVNFCTLVPMRSIPFSIVCLLGMNDQEFPRNQPQQAFDLMRLTSRRVGDRSHRDDDRYLFLEALLSARQAFYISYIGRSERDNQNKNPSNLVNDLKLYLDQSFYTKESKPVSVKLTKIHYLQAFNEHYFIENKEIQSYQQQWLIHALNKILDDGNIQPETVTSININKLIHFYKNPIRYFYQSVLQIRLPYLQQRYSDDEYFELNALQQYQLLQQSIEKQTFPQVYELTQRGHLPIGVGGEYYYQHLQEVAQPLLQRWEPIVQQQESFVDKRLILSSGKLLEIRFMHLIPSGQAFIRPGELKAGDMLQAWLYHLCLIVSQVKQQPSTLFLGKKKSFKLQPVPLELANNYLTFLCEKFIEGQQQPLYFMADIGLMQLENEHITKIKQAFYGDRFHRGIGQDLYHQHAILDIEQFLEQCAKNTNDILQPLLNYYEPY